MEAQSPTEEVDYVCATIRRLLAKDHTLRCRDIAVLSNQMTDYRSILETAMERYKLPYYMDEKESMLYTPLLVYLHTLLGILRQTRPDTELLLYVAKKSSGQKNATFTGDASSMAETVAANAADIDKSGDMDSTDLYYLLYYIALNGAGVSTNWEEILAN